MAFAPAAVLSPGAPRSARAADVISAIGFPAISGLTREEAVVRELDGLHGDLGAIGVQAGPRPADRDHAVEVPGGHDVAVAGHRLDRGGLPLHPVSEAAQPRRQLGAVLADGPAQLDVAVLDAGRQLPDEAVVSA